MRKCLFFCASVIFSVSLSIFVFINVNVVENINKNQEVVDSFENIFSYQDFDTVLEYESVFPKMEIDVKDYIGVINVSKSGLLLPVLSRCDNNIINIQSACSYSNESLVILGSNLKNSFVSFREYDVDDIIMFTNTLGQTFQYEVKEIKRIDKLSEISIVGDLVIVIKNYYDMEYVVFICDFY